MITISIVTFFLKHLFSVVVGYSLIFYYFISTCKNNNCENIVKFVVSVYQYKYQLTSIFKRKKTKNKPITERKKKKRKKKKPKHYCSYGATQCQHSGCIVPKHCIKHKAQC